MNYLIGSVYVYGSVGNIWSRQSKLVARDDVSTYDRFGSAVSIYTTTVMIGATGVGVSDGGVLISNNDYIIYMLFWVISNIGFTIC